MSGTGTITVRLTPREVQVALKCLGRGMDEVQAEIDDADNEDRDPITDMTRKDMERAQNVYTKVNSAAQAKGWET